MRPTPLLLPTLTAAPLVLLALAPYLRAAAPQEATAAASAASAAEVAWRTDYAGALKEAREKGKPLAVVFRCER